MNRVSRTVILALKVPLAFALWVLIGFGLPFVVVWLYWSGNLIDIWNEA
jgi:hypothetical protein